MFEPLSTGGDVKLTVTLRGGTFVSDDEGGTGLAVSDRTGTDRACAKCGSTTPVLAGLATDAIMSLPATNENYD